MTDTTATSQAPSAVNSRQAPSLPVRFIDRPEVEETFIDTITGVLFDGQTLRIGGAVTRIEMAQGRRTAVATRYTACRLVMTPSAAVELINQLQQLTARLRQAANRKSEQTRAQSNDEAQATS